MNATILHESRGRIRFRLRQKQMTLAQADLLEAWIQGKSWCRQVTVHERTCCVILYYDGTRQAVLNEIRHFSWQEAERTTALPAHSSRALNREFEEKLVAKVVCKAACTLFLPPPLRIARILWHMIPFVRRGLRCLLRRRIKVELLDALSISISACRRDFGTAGMVMFLLEVGELLEEWTRKKSVADLARCMSLNVDRVWLRTAQGESAGPCVPDPAGGCRSGPRRRHHPRGWSGAGGGGHRQSGVPHRRIHPGTQAPRRRGLCRHRGGGGRMCAGGEASLRPEPL